MNPVRLKTYINLLIVSIIWGAAAVVIKFTLSQFAPFTFMGYRFFISSLAALISFLIIGFNAPKNPRIFLLAAIYGFSQTTLALGFLFFGTDKTTSIDANLLSSIAPITTVVAGAVFLREHVTKREKIGIAIAFLGTLVTVLEPVLKNHDGLLGLEGNILVLISVLIGTANAVFAKIILRDKVDPFFATNLAFIVGLFTTLPILFLRQSPGQLVAEILKAPLPYHLGVFYMAIISGTFAYTLWHKAERSIEVGEVSLFAYLYPVFGTPLSVLWLKEKISLPFVIGALVIAFGVIIAEYKKKRYN